MLDVFIYFYNKRLRYEVLFHLTPTKKTILVPLNKIKQTGRTGPINNSSYATSNTLESR
jgi:hypothetical protein